MEGYWRPCPFLTVFLRAGSRLRKINAYLAYPCWLHSLNSLILAATFCNCFCYCHFFFHCKNFRMCFLKKIFFWQSRKLFRLNVLHEATKSIKVAAQLYGTFLLYSSFFLPGSIWAMRWIWKLLPLFQQNKTKQKSTFFFLQSSICSWKNQTSKQKIKINGSEEERWEVKSLLHLHSSEQWSSTRDGFASQGTVANGKH